MVFDVKNGAWHIKLDESSSQLTIFATPFGKYYWVRVPRGNQSGPEAFQHKLKQALEGLPGIGIVANDILVVWDEEHKEEAISDHDADL